MESYFASFFLNLLLSSFSLLFLLVSVFIWFVVFYCMSILFLNFPFSDVFQSVIWCQCFAAFPDHLQPLVSCIQDTVLASKAEGTIRTYLAGFKCWKLWASFNCFRRMPTMLRPTYSAWFFKQILLPLYLPLFTVLTGLNVWPVCWRSLIILTFLPWLVRPNEFWANRSKAKKEPITSEMLKSLVTSKISDKSPSLSDFRTVALCLLSYAGFFVSVSYAQ